MEIWVVDELDQSLLDDISSDDAWESGQNHVAWMTKKSAMDACENSIRLEIRETLENPGEFSKKELTMLRKWKPKWKDNVLVNPVTGSELSLRKIKVRQ